MDRDKIQHILLFVFIAPLAILCLIDRQIHMLCVVCICAILSYYFWHGGAGYYGYHGFWKSAAFMVIGIVCIVAGCFGKNKYESTEVIQGTIAKILVEANISDCAVVSNGLESIYNATCPPGTIYLVKHNTAADAIQSKYEKQTKKELQCVWSDASDRTKFSLLSADGENCVCIVKPKNGYDIVVVVEK